MRELFDDVVVEFAAALIGSECYMPIGGLLVRIPADQHRARLLLAVEPQQQIGKAENSAGGPVALSADVLRQRVIGAMREEIAVDDEQRPAYAMLRTARAIWHVAVLATADTGFTTGCERRLAAGTASRNSTQAGA